MAVTTPVLTAAILAAAPELKGPDWAKLAGVVSTGVAAWMQLPVNLAMQGATSGPAGGGLVNGKFLMATDVLLVSGALTAAGLVGPNAASIGRAVSVGVFGTFNGTGQYIGASAGVGVGTDVSKVTVSNPVTLTGAIQAAATGAGMVGPDMAKLSAALGAGLAALFLTGTGTGVVTGPAGPAPAVGTSFSRVV